jgi:hypothetical protein
MDFRKRDYWINERVNERASEWTREWMNERTSNRTSEWMKEWVNETAIHYGLLTGKTHYLNIQDLRFLKMIAVTYIELRYKLV